jgi:hypothetical protein
MPSRDALFFGVRPNVPAWAIKMQTFLHSRLIAAAREQGSPRGRLDINP